MTAPIKENYVTATNRFFSLFPLHLANVSKILIEKASHLKDGATLLHLFDLSHLNLKTKRIFLIDLQLAKYENNSYFTFQLSLG